MEKATERAKNDRSKARVAIACQGGGSHTAFTAGVLQGLMESLPEDVDVVALSGTSGGAICAALAWDGLVRNDRKLAAEKLRGFWEAMAATDPMDRIANETLMSVMGLRDLMVMPEVSPYNLPTWGEDRFREIIGKYFDFEELRKLAAGRVLRFCKLALSKSSAGTSSCSLVRNSAPNACWLRQPSPNSFAQCRFPAAEFSGTAFFRRIRRSTI